MKEEIEKFVRKLEERELSREQKKMKIDLEFGLGLLDPMEIRDLRGKDLVLAILARLEQREICPECGGIPKLHLKRDCPTCFGTGFRRLKG